MEYQAGKTLGALRPNVMVTTVVLRGAEPCAYHAKHHSLAERQMIENPELAKQISDLMIDMFTRLSDSCVTVETQCSEQEYKAYLKSTARIAGGIVMDVMEPLYDRHPHLKPPNWDEIDTVPS